MYAPVLSRKMFLALYPCAAFENRLFGESYVRWSDQGNLSSTGVRKINDLVHEAVSVDTPEPIAIRMYTIPLRVVDVPNPEPVAVLNAM